MFSITCNLEKLIEMIQLTCWSRRHADSRVTELYAPQRQHPYRVINQLQLTWLLWPSHGARVPMHSKTICIYEFRATPPSPVIPRRIHEKSRELSRQWSNVINLAFQVDIVRDSECAKYAINYIFFVSKLKRYTWIFSYGYRLKRFNAANLLFY